MFTRQEFEQSYKQHMVDAVLPLQVQEFEGEEDFSFDAEQRITIIRGSREIYHMTLRFWVHYLRFVLYRDIEQGDHTSPRDQRMDKEYEPSEIALHPQISLFQPISEQRMSALVKDCTSTLRRPFTLELHGQFVAAMLMSDDWNDKEVLCETEDEFVGFAWNTSA